MQAFVFLDTTRLVALASEEAFDGDTRRLTKLLRKHAEYLFTFLDYADVPFENNFAGRQIRPAVILRKNSQSDCQGDSLAEPPRKRF